ncbi:MAG TPA: cupin domain-containing protein [Gaiellaceae bacterium]|nr:cupin domain-containing protein [Gaiellaceae bacterium]
MPEAVVVPPGGGEIIGNAPQRRIEIISDHDSLHATWSRYAPDLDGADLHVHREHTDLFYVLEGELVLRLGPDDRRVPAAPGTLVRIPPLVVHGFRSGSVGTRYLNLHAPGSGFADFLRASRDGRELGYDQFPPPADGGRSPEDAVSGRGEVVAERPGLRVALLADAEAIGIAETLSEEAGPAPPPHVHARHAESFYVLEGELTLTVDGREVHAAAGSWVQVPAGVPHTFAFPDARLRFLDVHTPGCGFGAFLRGLHAARTDEELAAVRAAFDQAPA